MYAYYMYVMYVSPCTHIMYVYVAYMHEHARLHESFWLFLVRNSIIFKYFVVILQARNWLCDLTVPGTTYPSLNLPKSE